MNQSKDDQRDGERHDPRPRQREYAPRRYDGHEVDQWNHDEHDPQLALRNRLGQVPPTPS